MHSEVSESMAKMRTETAEVRRLRLPKSLVSRLEQAMLRTATPNADPDLRTQYDKGYSEYTVFTNIYSDRG